MMFLKIREETDGAMIGGAEITTSTTYINVDRIDTILVVEGTHGSKSVEVGYGSRSIGVSDEAVVKELVRLLLPT